jgi:hypothetical protein
MLVTDRDQALRFSSPYEYSRCLRRAHEQALAGVADPGIHSGLIASWRRSMALGINPDQHRPRHVREVSEAVAVRREHRLQAVVPALTDLLADESSSGRHLLIIADAQGEVLWRVGSRDTLRRADGLEFVEGADWSEAGIGTNAISEALANGAPAQIFSAEHLVRSHHDWACTASPIRDPFTGEILGVLDVSGPLDTVTADSLRMVKCGVRLAEELLKVHDGGRQASARRSPEARIAAASPGPAALFLELLGEQPAAVFDGGRRRALTLRRAEILALLDSRQRGWSADELAYQVHGDAGMPATIRAEMHRIRTVLGGVVESNPYRFADSVQVTSDAGLVLQRLRDGRVSEALDVYAAPLLPRSAALAVELLREELNLAVGAAVRASSDAGLLMRWCATDMGSLDAEAVEQLGQLLGTGDARYLAFQARSERADRELLGG